MSLRQEVDELKQKGLKEKYPGELEHLVARKVAERSNVLLHALRCKNASGELQSLTDQQVAKVFGAFNRHVTCMDSADRNALDSKAYNIVDTAKGLLERATVAQSGKPASIAGQDRLSLTPMLANLQSRLVHVADSLIQEAEMGKHIKMPTHVRAQIDQVEQLMKELNNLSVRENNKQSQLDSLKKLESALGILLGGDSKDAVTLTTYMTSLREALANPAACTPENLKAIEANFNTLFKKAEGVLEGHIQSLEQLIEGSSRSLHDFFGKVEKAFVGVFTAAAVLTAIAGVMAVVVLAVPAFPLWAGLAFLGLAAGGVLVLAGGVGGYAYARHQQQDELSASMVSAMKHRVETLKNGVRALKKETALIHRLSGVNSLEMRRGLETHRKGAIEALAKGKGVSIDFELSHDTLVRQDLEGVKDAFGKVRKTKEGIGIDHVIVGVTLDVVDQEAYKGDVEGYATALKRVYVELYQAKQIRDDMDKALEKSRVSA